VAGIAVDALGHSHPKLVAALQSQGEKLWHVSNIYRIPQQEALAAKLCAATFADVIFFTNSGTEAVECALKAARRYHAANGQPERIDIIGFEGSFHGRSYAAVNASGNASYLEGFGPRLPGYVQLPFGDSEALKSALGPTTAAIIIEPVQGEGGARSLSAAQLDELRALCTEAGVLLIYDEIQCGLGRTGRLFAYEWAENAAPDIMCVAKALGGGFPVGACLATAEAAKGMTVGSHGSTYGGNPLAMAVGLAAVEELTRPETLANVRDIAGYFTQQLTGLKERHPQVIAEIRGKGLLIGLRLIPNNRDFMALARDEKLLIAGGGDNCVRLLPSLLLTREEASEAVEKLERACEAAKAKAAA
jgi:acetylornithine/N-succinyldiaminopimelate aminotransferase